MVNLAQHEANFWNALNARTVKDSGPNLVGLPNYSYEQLTGLYPLSAEATKAYGASPGKGGMNGYDFFNVDMSGSTMLPLFDDSGEDSTATTLGEALKAGRTPAANTNTPPDQDGVPPVVQMPGNDVQLSNTQEKPEISKPLRRGLRPRTRPKNYSKLDSAESSDGDSAPKSKSKRSRSQSRKTVATAPAPAPAVSAGVLPGGICANWPQRRQERPLPKGLDEKQRRRVLRNRASAERSRLKRLGQIVALEEENQSLRAQLAQQQQSNGNVTANAQIMQENDALKAELRLLNDRVHTLTRLLTQARQ